MISEKFNEQTILDKLSKDLANSIDKQILYENMGWTIVTAPSWSFYTGNALDMLEWLKTNCGEHHCWDGMIAFEQGKDATMFILRWK
jgi:hypothetical protein